MTRPRKLVAALFAVVVAAGTLLATVPGAASATSADHPWPLLRQGSAAENVVTAQQLLRARGYTLPVDGAFGTQTASAVRRFQSDRGIAVDGIIGPVTWSKLVVTTRAGSRGWAVTALQSKLAGTYGIAVDGIFGPSTEAAVRRFQADQGIAVDGIAGYHTWNQILHHLAVPTPGFAHQTFRGGATAASDWGAAGPKVVAVRVGRHPGYDRFVIEFSGTVPSYVVSPQGATFTLSPKGTKVTLEGTAGVLIVLKPIAWMSYSGAHGFRVDLPRLRQVRPVENYEGTQQWGLGIRGVPLLRVFTLHAPERLVVDVTVS